MLYSTLNDEEPGQGGQDVKFFNDLRGVFDVPTSSPQLEINELGPGLGLRLGHFQALCLTFDGCFLSWRDE